MHKPLLAMILAATAVPAAAAELQDLGYRWHCKAEGGSACTPASCTPDATAGTDFTLDFRRRRLGLPPNRSTPDDARPAGDEGGPDDTGGFFVYSARPDSSILLFDGADGSPPGRWTVVIDHADFSFTSTLADPGRVRVSFGRCRRL